MSQQHTYSQIATNWALWNEFVNASGAMDRAEFDALTVEQKVSLQIAAFGAEAAGKTSKYEVSNIRSAHSFGIYEAESAEAAIEACCKDAGYESKAQAEDVMGVASDLVATEVQ